ncbi:MAG: hypothetical protein M3Y87_13920, partial [Myxococcota bacterium]|nr:hypothetical protein [Myxococcota bacterium]
MHCDGALRRLLPLAFLLAMVGCSSDDLASDGGMRVDDASVDGARPIPEDGAAPDARGSDAGREPPTCPTDVSA